MLIYRDKEFETVDDLYQWFYKQPLVIEGPEARCAGQTMNMNSEHAVSTIRQSLFSKLQSEVFECIQFGNTYFRTKKCAEEAIDDGWVELHYPYEDVLLDGELGIKIKNLIKETL